MKKICCILIILLTSLYAMSIVLAASETLVVDWSKVELKATVSASSNVIAVSGSASSDTKYDTTVTLTGSLTGEPEYNTAEYKHTKTEWFLSVDGLTLKGVSEGKLDQWQEPSTVKCTRYGTSPAKVYVGGTAKVKYTFEKKNNSSVTTTSEHSVSVPDGTKSGETDERAVVWVVGVGSIQYKKTSEPDTAYSSGNSVGTGAETVASAFNKTELDFKAIRNPSNSPSWPENFPTWRVKPKTGADKSHGSGETKQIKFEMSGLSSNPPDNPESQTVYAKCGNSEASLNIETFVYKVWISSHKDGSEIKTDTDPAKNSANQPATFTLSRDKSDGDLTVSFGIKKDANTVGTGKRHISDGDYVAPVETSVNFKKGKTTSDEFKISVQDDGLYEGDEYFGIQLGEDADKYILVSKNEAESTAGSGGTGTDPNDKKGFCLIKINDHDKLELFKIKYTGIKDLKPDPDSTPLPPGTTTVSWSAGPHWLKGKTLVHNPTGDAGYVPALYAGGTKIKIEAYFNGEIDTTPALDVYSYFDTSIASVSYASEKTKEANMTKLAKDSTGTTAKVVKGTYEATVNLQETVAYESSLSTEFTYQLEGGANKKTETSTSCLYVTRSDPGNVQLYHTVVHIGCAAAHGKSAVQDVFDAIWAKFAGNDICISKVKIENGKVIDDPNGKLYYYGMNEVPPQFWAPWDVPPGEPANQYTKARANSVGNTQELLTIHDGTCGAWAEFVVDINKVQKVQSPVVHIQVQGSKEILYAGATKGKHHGEIPREKSWGDHAIVAFKGGNYYDTSYGEAYSQLDNTDYEGLTRLAKVFHSYYGEITPGSGVKDWESSANANATWVTIMMIFTQNY